MQILLEHTGVPGTLYEDVLIFGGNGGILNEMVNLTEATDPANINKPIKFRGKFQEAESINKNKRMYPFVVLETNVKRLKEAIDAGGLCGELDHPTDSIVHFTSASHKITKLWWEGNSLMGEGTILSTPSGRILRALINDGVRIGISSRGVGNGKVNEEGVLVIGESYKLITFDAVADPSTYAAFQEKIAITKREQAVETQNINIPTKNEVSSIHTVSKDVVLACLSGIVKEQTNLIKARMN